MKPLDWWCIDALNEKAEIWPNYPGADSAVHYSKFFQRLYDIYDLRYAYPDSSGRNHRKMWKVQSGVLADEVDASTGCPWIPRISTETEETNIDEGTGQRRYLDMPRREDISKILIIGSGPIVIGQSAEFDYSGTQACKALKAEGFEVVLVNSNPATIMTDPEMADRTYIEPLTVRYLEEIIRREALRGVGKGMAVLPTVGGQTALNLAVELADGGVLEKYNVKLIGAQLTAIKKAEDRLMFKDAMTRIGLEVPRSALVNNLKDGMEFTAKLGFPVVLAPFVHPRRHRRRHRLQRRRTGRSAGSRARSFAGSRSAHRGERARLEGIRVGGDARPARQRHHHLLDRKFRRHGRAHRRFDHRCPGADAQRPRIPADARRLHQGHARDRRRDRRIEHSVRGASDDRTDGGHRDEPEGIALFGPGIEGDRIPDRQDRGQAGRRLHARRNHQRHHPQDAGLLRADPRLRGRQDSEMAV